MQAAALRRIASAAVQLTRAVYDAYRPELDEDTTAVAVGALLGAVIGVTNPACSAATHPDSSPPLYAASIAGGARQGRGIFANLRKAMCYIIAVHVPIFGMSLIPVFIKGWPRSSRCLLRAGILCSSRPPWGVGL